MLLKYINNVRFEVEVHIEMLLKIHIFWGVNVCDCTGTVFIKISEHPAYKMIPSTILTFQENTYTEHV